MHHPTVPSHVARPAMGTTCPQSHDGSSMLKIACVGLGVMGRALLPQVAYSLSKCETHLLANSAELLRLVAGECPVDLVYVLVDLHDLEDAETALVLGRMLTKRGMPTFAVALVPEYQNTPENTGFDHPSDALEHLLRLKYTEQMRAAASQVPLLFCTDAIPFFRSITHHLQQPGHYRLHLQKLQATLCAAGPTVMGIGHGQGENAGIDALEQAIAALMLGHKLDAAAALLVSIEARPEAFQVRKLKQIFDKALGWCRPDCDTSYTVTNNETLTTDYRITLIVRCRAAA